MAEPSEPKETVPSAPISETTAEAPAKPVSEPAENGEIKGQKEVTNSPEDTSSDSQKTPESKPDAPPELLSLPESAADGLIKKPFPKPADTAKPDAPAELKADQKSKYDALFETVSAWTEVAESSAKGSTSSPITDEERMFLTRECLLRYLRATKWNMADASKRLMGTLTWRREYGVLKHTADYISEENETGKQVLLGFDNSGRPCLYLNPSKQNTKYSPRQIQHLVFMLERAIDLMVPGQETLSLLVNFKETRSGQSASISQGRETLYILQNHYPERLGRALVINVPFVVWGFFKLITPFIDPLTRPKLKFNEDLRLHVPPAQLIKPCGGDVEFEYEHSTYWPALNKLAEQRRKEYEERWVSGGKLVGEHEGYLKGGAEQSLSASEKEEATVSTAPSTITPEISEKLQDAKAAQNGEELPDISGLKV